MCAEKALRDATVLFTCKTHAIAFEVCDPLGGPFGYNFNGSGVSEVVTFFFGVSSMLLPGVLGVHGAKCCIDAASCERSVRVMPRALADRQDIDPSLCQFDRGSQTRSTGSDH